MAYYNQIGLLVLSDDGTKFLVCEKAPEYETTDYITPGGLLEENSDEACLRNEIDEELGCAVDFATLALVGEYEDVAAGWPNRDVRVKLYRGKLIGVPRPCAEIEQLHWIGKEDAQNPRVAPIIRNKIIPDLLERKILR